MQGNKRTDTETDTDTGTGTGKKKGILKKKVKAVFKGKFKRDEEAPSTEDPNLRYAEALLEDMDRNERISVESFRPEFEDLEKLKIGKFPPLHSLVAATASIINKKRKGSGGPEDEFYLEKARADESMWTTVFPGFLISPSNASSDADDTNIKLILQVLAKRRALKKSRLRLGQFCGKFLAWWPSEDGEIPNEPLVQSAIGSDTGFENMIADFSKFVNAVCTHGYDFNTGSTTDHVRQNGYEEFSAKNPIQADGHMAFNRVDPSSHNYIIVEEFKKLGYGLGLEILHKFRRYHKIAMASIMASLQKFYEACKLRSPRADPSTFNVVSWQGGVQALALESRVIGISDGSVYLALHISGVQDIDDWPLDAKPAVELSIKDGKKVFKEVPAYAWRDFPRLNVDKVDVATNEGDMMKLRASVIANELFRVFPNLRKLCKEYLEGGEEAAKQFALINGMSPDKDYVDELRPFYSHMKCIVKRRLLETAINFTGAGMIMFAREFSNMELLCDTERSSKVFKVQLKGESYILKTFKLNDAGLLAYISEFFAYRRGEERGIDVMVKMYRHGRLNGLKHFGSTSTSYDDGTRVHVGMSNLKLENDAFRSDVRNANEEAPFFVLIDEAQGRYADFSNVKDMELVRGALSKLKQAGIQRPELEESNFIIDNHDNIKVVDFAIGLGSDEDELDSDDEELDSDDEE